ncbi:hypothetical protein DE146DRAFT_601099 [Phaeosphaeria sp. MPI-PUGE-AT-0046c]|nr:hypothetical protein DE146DRAFT_601099 [Phaeosphaeria sp. MPI-PUGE-AT-0046c]
MLPMAGLFLPESLHRRERPTTSQTEKNITRPNFFQRTSLRPEFAAREARSSVTSFSDMHSSSEDITHFSSSTIAFQFADFVFTSGKASSESRDLAFLIDRVRQDVAEASRLYLSPTILNFLDAWPDKKSRIDAILLDIHRALNDIGEYVADTFRVPGDEGETFGVKRKLEWISRQHKKITAKQQLLSTCHHSLVTAINIMQTVELCGVNNGAWQDPIYEAPVHPWVKPDHTDVLRGPYSRRETRLTRRAYFRNSVNDSVNYLTGKDPALSNDSSPVAELEHTRLQPPPSFLTARRSFDSSLHTYLTTTTDTYQAYHPSMRQSSDVAQPLPTLAEKTIERNDSTTSTTAIVSVSQVAKRCHANPVYIRKGRDRHRSLPASLPHVQSHSSLTDDLADYMTHLSPQGDQVPSVECHANLDTTSPSISFVSSPAATTQASMPPIEARALSRDDEASGIIENEIDITCIQSPEPGDDALHNVSNAETGAEPRSSATKDCQPPGSQASNPSTTPLPSIQDDDFPLRLLQQKLLHQTYVPEFPQPPPVAKKVTDMDKSTSAPPATAVVPKTPELPLVTDKSADGDKNESAPPTKVLQPIASTAVPSITTARLEVTPAKPMSAQTKRRAAHQRRMELAFGKS